MKTPLDVNTTTRLSGNAAVLPSGPGSAVKAVSRSVADGEASDDEVVVFDTFSCLIKDPDGTAPDCVDDTDPDKRLVTAGTDRFATDRVTATAVNEERYVGVGAEPHDGLVNKFPFDVAAGDLPVLGRPRRPCGQRRVPGRGGHRRAAHLQVPDLARRRARRDQQRRLRPVLDREDDVDRPGHRLDHRPVRGAGPQARRRHDRPRPRAAASPTRPSRRTSRTPRPTTPSSTSWPARRSSSGSSASSRSRAACSSPWPAVRARPRHLRARAARAAPSTPPPPDDASHAGGRVRRMKARLGRDTRVPIEEGPLRTIGWFRTHPSLV